MQAELRPPQVPEALRRRPPFVAVDPADGSTGPAATWTVPDGAKLLLVAPHPDDEVLAAGGLLQRVLERRGSARVVFLTNGDGYPEAVATQTKTPLPSPEDFLRYGRQRRAEAEEALWTLGLPPTWLVFLGFPDGGLDDLWGPYWSSDTPFVSPYTHLSRPAEVRMNTSVRGPEYLGRDLTEELRQVLIAWQPAIVVAPDPRDHHLDHCTAGMFVLEALRQVVGEQRLRMPLVLGYLVHFPDYPGSAAWRRQARGSGVCGSSDGADALTTAGWWHLDLTQDEVAGKALALLRYSSQVRVMRGFLAQFVQATEWFSHLTEAQVQSVPVQHALRVRQSRR